MSKEAVKVEEPTNPFEAFLKMDEPIVAKKEVTKEDDKEKEDKAAELLEAEAKKQEAAKKSTKEVPEDKEETEEEDKEDSADNNKEDDSGIFKTLIAEQVEKGVLNIPNLDEIEDSEEGLDKAIKLTVQNEVEGWKSSLPEDGQKFLEYITNGGKPEDFHKYYYNDGLGSFEDFKIEDNIENQKYVISQSLELEGFTEEEIKEELQDIEDMDKLAPKAAIHLKKLQKIEKENKKNLLEAQKAYAAEQETKRTKEWDEFKKGLYDKDTIAGFKFTQKMKDDTWEYMTKPLNKKTGETQYQKDSKENEDVRYLFAYLLKNKYDIKSLERQIESKTVSKIKDKLTNYTATKVKTPANKVKAENEREGSSFTAFKEFLNT